MPPPPGTRRTRWRRPRVLLLWGLAILAAFLGTVFVPLPRILLLRAGPPRTTSFIEARRDRLRQEGKDDRIERVPIPIQDVSPHLVKAVLAAEDARFFEHHGIDWDAISKARAYNAKTRGRKLRGASTITMQLAKNLYLSADRSMWRKAREAAIALSMDLLLSKKLILEHYLSSIEWGERIYGCEAAARTYFGVPTSRLRPDQAAWLAAMIPGPRLYLRSPARHERRARRIARFARQGLPVPESLWDDSDG